MHKESFIINRNTLLHVSTLLGHLQGERLVTVTLGLHFTVEWECAVDCVLRCFWRREISAVRGWIVYYVVFGAWTAIQARTAESSRHQKQRSTQSTAHSQSTVKCNRSVTVKKSSPWRWPSRVEIRRSVLQLMIKLSLCICWWLVFLYDIVHRHGTH
jgi:hypothetical protein